jgi:hypothetical protein
VEDHENIRISYVPVQITTRYYLNGNMDFYGLNPIDDSGWT